MSVIPQIIKSLKNLPPFPLVAQRAMLLLNNPEVAIQELVDIVKFDPAITANILRISNSAYFGLRREIHSLNQALLLLGTQELLKIIIASGATRFLNCRTPGYYTESQGLWRHSVSCAIMADLLSRDIQVSEGAMGFTAGLLHDIGKVVLSLFVEQKFSTIIQVVETKKVTFQDAEREVLGIDHSSMGGEMARIWDFPDRLRLVITHHHLDKAEGRGDDLVMLIHLADILVLMFGRDLGADGLAYTGYPEVLRHFHLRERDLERILLSFSETWQEAQALFGLAGTKHALQRAHC
jgi:putative nucleotidyltransferase with HDIG domain